MSLKNLSAKTKIHKILYRKLKNKKINKIYNKFEKSLNLKTSFAVAISGGPDSLALSFLAKIYSIKNNLNTKFYIVDHKLRSGSTKEAKKVKQILKKISINAQILTWRGTKPTKNIQSIARSKRYELLTNICKRLRINNILLGHHEDDLHENFFIRILRGSGLHGLVSLDKKSKVDNFNLLRPLLDQKKEDLIFLANFVFSFYVKDPSNYDQKFQRIKIRNLINQLKKDGLDRKKFSKTIENLKLSNSVINFYVEENIKRNSYFSKKKNTVFIQEVFFNQPYEIIFRSLSNLINLIGKRYYPVRGKKLENIINLVKNKSLHKVTLGGCIIEKLNETVIISKEP